MGSFDHRAPTPETTVAAIIGAIGAPDFPAVTAQALQAFTGFDLAAILMHRDARAALMFDNFDRVGCREGIQNYVRFTHRINPMLRHAPARGAVRARDFAVDRVDARLDDHIVHAPDEELGFRTVGWPCRLEEIGLYLNACGGIVELGFYRERARSAAPMRKLAALNAMAAPLVAAFERHRALRSDEPLNDALTAREREIVELMLRGCSSEAIALRLGRSRHTVKDHRKQIFRKLGIASLAELFALHRTLN
jgi:DNA-binding CsgD family transcriptional regulator